MTSRAHILLVEDSATQALLLATHLAQAGYTTASADDGEAAIAALDTSTFDLVLSDVVMPGMDGYKLCRRVKSQHPTLPVMLLTSLSDPMDIVHGLEAGADSFLRKPYEAGQLITKVQAILARKALREAGPPGSDLDVVMSNQHLPVTADRQQILDLLVSTFEDLVTNNALLAERDAALRRATIELHDRLDTIQRERRRLETVLDAVPHPMVIIDPNGTVTDASDRLCELVGRTRQQVIGHGFGDVLVLVDSLGEPIARRPLARALETGEEVELGKNFDLFAETADGQRVCVIAQASPVRDDKDQVIAVVGTMHQIDELADHDPVTALPNHRLFVSQIAHALSTLSGVGAVAAVVIDDFAALQVELGDANSDRLLASVAKTIKDCTARPEQNKSPTPGWYSIAHFGDGVFAVLWSGLDDDLRAVRLAGRLAEELDAASRHDLGLRFGIGLAIIESEDNPTDLAAATIAAARRCTESGGRIQIVDPEIDNRASVLAGRAGELRRALEHRELVVYYQPEMDLRTGSPVGAEALVRWQHPTEGLLSPGEFLPAAESAGLIADIGWYVLDEACRQAARWQRTLPHADLAISVNVDATQLANPSAVELVWASLRSSHLRPASLTLEITERRVVGQSDAVSQRLQELKQLGVRIAIDDFGTGYASLQQLRHLPIDTLKVDQEFVRGMSTESDDATIVAATIQLGRGLGLGIVAEGVETEEQLVRLRVLGCDRAQGFLWSRPLPAAEFESWWHTHATDHDTGLQLASASAVTDELAAEVDEVVAYLVHELRTPLAVVSGYAELALQDGGGNAEYLEPLLRGARSLNERLSSLADVRYANSGAITLTLELCNVGTAVHTIVTDHAALFTGTPINISVTGQVDAWIDPSRLSQALLNLLQNAKKFSPADSPIEVSVALDGARVEIGIRDHGPGIELHKRPELFRRFSRLGSSKAGMGLGLYLVRTIARAHGGDARYDDPPGCGALFTIALPVVQDAAEARGHPPTVGLSH